MENLTLIHTEERCNTMILLLSLSYIRWRFGKLDLAGEEAARFVLPKRFDKLGLAGLEMAAWEQALASRPATRVRA